MKRILTILALLFCTVAAFAGKEITFAELRAMVDAAPAVEIDVHVNRTFARPGTLRRSVRVDEDLLLTGRVSVPPDNPNKELSFQSHFSSTNTQSGDKCTFMQSEDGSLGVRLDFVKPKLFFRMARYSLTTINLKGCTICREGDSYIVDGLTAESIVSVERGTAADMPVKRRHVSELKPEDIFTWVTLEGCEYAFKDGAFINIYEAYAKGGGPKVEGVSWNGYMDGWASALVDEDSDVAYLLMNSRVAWRRDGSGVPKGRGTVSGIVTGTWLPRYGDVHAYMIRPMLREDIALKEDGGSRVIAEWDWNDGRKGFNTNMGYVEQIVAQDILPDIGEGLLSSDVTGVKYSRHHDFNNPEILPQGKEWGRGAKTYGSLRMTAPASGWWNWHFDCGNSLIITVSTKEVQGRSLYLAFSFSAGSQLASNSAFYPSFWCVEYSTDGVSYERADAPDAELRSVPWFGNYGNVGTDSYVTSYEAGLGLTEHVVKLPSTLMGRDKIYLRISPSRKVVSSLAPHGQACGTLTKELNAQVIVNFGTVKVAYN